MAYDYEKSLVHFKSKTKSDAFTPTDNDEKKNFMFRAYAKGDVGNLTLEKIEEGLAEPKDVESLKNFLVFLKTTGGFNFGTSKKDFKSYFSSAVPGLWLTLNPNPGATWAALSDSKKAGVLLAYYLQQFITLQMPGFKDSYKKDLKAGEGYFKIKDYEGSFVGSIVDPSEADFSTGVGVSSGVGIVVAAGVAGVAVAEEFGLKPQIGEFWEIPWIFRRAINSLIFGISSQEIFQQKNKGVAAGTAISIARGKLVELFDVYDSESNLGADITALGMTGDIDKQKLIDSILEDKSNAGKRLSRLSVEATNELLASGSSGLGNSIEQCVLSTVLTRIAGIRKNLRNLMLSKGSRPYGGRVIPVKTEKPESFMNLCSSPYSFYDYSRELTTNIHSKITYDFFINRIEEDAITGEIRELPLIFGGWKDKSGRIPRIKELFLVRNGAYANTIDGKRFPEGEKSKWMTKKESRGLTNAIGLGSDSSIMKRIKFKNISIKYKGENFATAKTNVDVDLQVDIPHLLLLQAKFQASSDKAGTENYEYGLLDLITYLNNSTIQDPNSNGGSKYYNPVYQARYNRIAMKIIPKASPNNALNKYPNIKKYVEKSSLYLDLALVDYTISKDEVLNKASLKINYKGYIRTRLNDAVTDCLTGADSVESLINKEKEFIKKIDRMCEIKDIRDAITEKNNQYEDQEEVREKSRRDQRNAIFTGLIKRNQMWFFEYDVGEILEGNVDSESKKITNIEVVKNYLLAGPQQLFREKANKTFNDMEGILQDEELVAENMKEKLSYFFFGDLLDVLMDCFYGAAEVEKDNTGFYVRDKEWQQYNENFPVKVLLPTFIYNEPKRPPKEINLADIPIASSFFANWFEKEVIDRDLRHYPLGTMINKLVGSLLNNVMNDNCFLVGSPERKYFSVKSDFGVFSNKDAGETPFNGLFSNPMHRHKDTASVLLLKEYAPFFVKNPNGLRQDHCNYLVVYEQINAFSDYSKIDLTKNSKNIIPAFRDLAIPEFKLKGQYTRRKGNKLISKTTALTQKISFKKTDIPYQRESRYFADNLNTLSQLASVHNVTITTKPLLTMFPGMIVWVDAGLLDPPNTVKSIAWLLGMGGFHVTTEVTHKADIKLNTLNRSTFTTVIEGIYVHSGAPKVEDKCVEKTPKAEEAADAQETTDQTAAVPGTIKAVAEPKKENPSVNDPDATEAEPPQTTVVTIPSAVGQADAIDLYDATVHDDPVGKNVFASGALYYVIKEKIKDETQKGTGVKLKIAILGDREYWTTNFLTNRGKTVTFI